MSKFFENIGIYTVATPIAILVVFAIGVPAAMLNGWVLTKLWTWFIVPVFHLPFLGLWQAIGFSLLVRTITNQDVKDERKTAEKFATAFLTPFFVLGLGAFIHWMMR